MSRQFPHSGCPFPLTQQCQSPFLDPEIKRKHGNHVGYFPETPRVSILIVCSLALHNYGYSICVNDRVCQSMILNHSSKHVNKNATSKTSSNSDHLVLHFFGSIFQPYFYLPLLQFARMRLGQRFDDPVSLSSILPSVLKNPDTIHHFALNRTDGHTSSGR